MKRISITRLDDETLDTPTVDTLALDALSAYSDAEFEADVRGEAQSSRYADEQELDDFDNVDLVDIQTLDELVGAGWK